jgi:hypothetical protein
MVTDLFWSFSWLFQILMAQEGRRKASFSYLDAQCQEAYYLAPMAYGEAEEYPPLWPRGVYELSLTAIEEACVSSFDLSTTRKDLMAALQLVVEHLNANGIPGEIWLDGSFVTEKISPKDIDFILVADSRVYDEGTDEQREVLDGLTDGEMWKPPLHCDTNAAYIDPPEQQGTSNVIDYWTNRFGLSLGDRTPKGIVVIKLGAS